MIQRKRVDVKSGPEARKGTPKSPPIRGTSLFPGPSCCPILVGALKVELRRSVGRRSQGERGELRAGRYTGRHRPKGKKNRPKTHQRAARPHPIHSDRSLYTWYGGPPSDVAAAAMVHRFPPRGAAILSRRQARARSVLLSRQKNRPAPKGRPVAVLGQRSVPYVGYFVFARNAVLSIETKRASNPSSVLRVSFHLGVRITP